MNIYQVQAQGIGNHAEAGKAHCRSPEHRVKLPAESADPHAGRQRDPDDVVNERPEKILVDVCESCAAQTDCRRYVAQLAFHQNHVCRIDGNIRTGTDSDTDICPGEGWCVVDTVADHGNFALLAEAADYRFLAVWQNACDDFVHASLTADGAGSFFVVAGEHYHADAHILQLSDCLRTVFLDYVSHCDYAAKLAALHEEKRCLAMFSQVLSLLFHVSRDCNFCADELQAAAVKFFAVQAGKNSIARQNLKICDFCRRHAHASGRRAAGRPLDDGPGQRVLALGLKSEGGFHQGLAGETAGRQHVRNLRFAFCNRACFIKCNNLHLSCFFKGCCRLEQHTVLSAYAVAHHDCNRGCKAKGARTADYQY